MSRHLHASVPTLTNSTWPARIETSRELLILIGGTEDFEECDLKRKRFLNIAPKIVSQLFQSLNSAQHFRRRESFRQSGSFLFCGGQIAARDLGRCA